jgi:2'-5' RNA ligase
MPYAIALVLDDDSAARVGALTDAVDRIGPAARPAVRQGGPPHITLGVYPDNVDAAGLRASVVALGGAWRALTVGLAGLGTFPGAPAVLFAAPVVTSALLVRHAQLAARHSGDPYYASGSWVPHLTLAQDLPDARALGDALAAVAAGWQPFAVTLDRLALFRFHPLEVLELQPLQ